MYNENGFVMIEVEWGGEILKVAGVYAPVTNNGTTRADFFRSLKGKITADTLAGGDWNCVPDVTLDVESQNPLGYPNKGATELAEIMGDVGLVDERREQIGTESEVTRRGRNNAGTITGTRLDRWYTPTTGKMGDVLWTFSIHNTFTFKNG